MVPADHSTTAPIWRSSFAMVMVVVAVAMGGGGAKASTFVLKWSPHAQSDGVRAFEKIQDDRSQNSDPGPVRHIHVQGDAYRFDVVGKAGVDRQRSEVVGMVANRSTGKELTILKGESWRIRHKMFIPKSLVKSITTRGGAPVTHVMELVSTGSSSLPILTLSLRASRKGHTVIPTIDLTLVNRDGYSGASTILASAALSRVQEKWVESEITFCAVTNGTVQWQLSDAATKLVIVQGDGFGELFVADPVRPKWGIHRSVTRDSGSHLENCFMLMKDLQAWKQE